MINPRHKIMHDLPVFIHSLTKVEAVNMVSHNAFFYQKIVTMHFSNPRGLVLFFFSIYFQENFNII